MNKKSRTNTRRLAFGAMLTALGVVLLYIGAVTDILDLTLCAAASLITVFAMLEFGRSYAYMIYASTAIIAFLILPSKFAAVAYACVSLYTIIKANIEKLSKAVAWLIKLLYFNVILTVGILAAKYVFMLPDEGIISDISLAVLGNAAFVLFDIAISKLIVLYAFTLRRRFKIDKYIARFR